MKTPIKSKVNGSKLAALGDAYVTFVYSLALSSRNEWPSGKE